MRALPVLRRLIERHTVSVLAGGDAYDALISELPVVRVPNLRYHYRRPGKLSGYQTLRRNLSMALDLLWNGAGCDMVADELRTSRADLVISDGEPFTLRAAARAGIPTISFDNFGMLAHCELDLGLIDKLRVASNAVGYRLLLGGADRILIASFFPCRPRNAGVRVIGPVIRPEAAALTPTRGKHLLVYVSKGESEYTPRLEHAFHLSGLPIRLYGTPRRGTSRNIRYCEMANLPFLEDLAACRAVVATTGHQLLSEVVYFRKPVLGIPIDCIEQRVNALQIEKLGIGRMAARDDVDAALLHGFLAHESAFVANFNAPASDGIADAIDAIEDLATGLLKAPAEAPPPIHVATPGSAAT